MLVDLWYWFTAGLEPDTVEALAAILSDEERRRAARFVRNSDRRDYVAAHALLRHALSRRASDDHDRLSTTGLPVGPNPGDRHGWPHGCEPRDWVFTTGANGKPSVVPPAPGSPPPTCNLSHAPGLVACVVAGGEAVGVDVEAVVPRAHGDVIARERFAPDEVDAYAALDDTARIARFIDLWTLREAYVKGTGVGLWGPDVPGLRFSFDGPSGLQCHRTAGAAAWTFALFAPQGYRVAVASELPLSAEGRWTLAVNVLGDVPPGDASAGANSAAHGSFPEYVRATDALSCEPVRAHAASSVLRPR